MARKIIAVDLDDVLAASAENFVNFSNERWGTNLTVEDYDERWAKMWGIEHQQGVERAAIIYGSKIFTKIKAIDTGKEVLAELSKVYTLVIVTSRAKQAKQDTKDWLGRYYGGIFDEIYMTGFYDAIKEDSHVHTKEEICREIGANWLIDDHPKHCLAVAEAGMQALLFGDYSWNRNIKPGKNLTKVKNWQEVANYFREVSNA